MVLKKNLIILVVLIALCSCNNASNDSGLNPITELALNPGIGVKSDNSESCTARQIVEWAFFIDGTATGGGGFNDAQRDYTNNRLLMRGNHVISDDGSLEPGFIESRDVVIQRMVNKILGRTYYYPEIRFQMDLENRNFLVKVPEYDPLGINIGKEVLMEMDAIPFPEGYIPYKDSDDGAAAFASEFCKMTIDTIAYIPNKVGIKAEKNIKEAYANGDYITCYELFKKAYTFYPITGAEWRALKAQGVE